MDQIGGAPGVYSTPPLAGQTQPAQGTPPPHPPPSAPGQPRPAPPLITPNAPVKASDAQRSENGSRKSTS